MSSCCVGVHLPTVGVGQTEVVTAFTTAFAIALEQHSKQRFATTFEASFERALLQRVKQNSNVEKALPQGFEATLITARDGSMTPLCLHCHWIFAALALHLTWSFGLSVLAERLVTAGYSI